MFLDDLCTSNPNKKLSKLSESLNEDYGIDLSVYTELDKESLELFLNDLESKKQQVMMESSFNSYHNDPEYTRVVLLSEAIRIILKEIHPKRSLKKVQKTNETLDYKVHTATGSAVDHDIDEDSPRPDLYWRKHQWEDEQQGDNYPVEAHDAPPAGEAYDLDWETNNPPPSEETEKMAAYAPNSQPVGGTAENEQQAGVYVAVMNPNRFLGDKDVNIMAIEPVVNSQNEVSPLSRKVPRKMVDVDEQENEDVEKMTPDMNIIGGLSGLLESSLLNESELQRAEIVFATNDLVMRLGKMIEDLSKMGTDDIMPLVDGIRDNFGARVAEGFSRESEKLIQGAANSIDSMKQMMDTYREKFETHISDEDAKLPLDASGVGHDNSLDSLGLGGDEDKNDEVGDLSAMGPEIAGDEAEDTEGLGDLAGGEEPEKEEPLGRAKKLAESKVININGKKVRLTLEQIAILHKARLLTEKISKLQKTTVLNVQGQKIRINENQLKSLIFAKKFKKRVDEKKANIVKLSENQAKMQREAKAITSYVRALMEKKASKDWDGNGEIESDEKEWKGVRNNAIKKAMKKETNKNLDEDKKKPSSGLSKKKRSDVVKAAKKGKDIGKKGKEFKKIEKKAEEGGARDPEAVAGAVMWKNIKRESVELDEKKASKDWDGNGKVESDEKEWKGVRNNAIKKAVKKEKKAKK